MVCTKVGFLSFTPLHQSFREVFDLYDVEGQGYISLDSFPMAFRACGFAPTVAELSLLVTKVDNQGRVYWNQFDEVVKDGQAYNFGTQQTSIAAFQVFDKDDNGTVSANEWSHVMLSLGDKLAPGNNSLTPPSPFPPTSQPSSWSCRRIGQYDFRLQPRPRGKHSIFTFCTNTVVKRAKERKQTLRREPFVMNRFTRTVGFV
eukprot:TRINITY_DN4436_c0_g1_i27.p1 TRINITY_DN4436_c0_g1~~TRINITY_DN4436_c0_g1_i27.p1  ORF type:complete len:202 (+),score=32.91 TRINITY_DN4436_c0_g1_i27:618-1223(+)